MSLVSVADFVDALRQSRLLEPEQLALVGQNLKCFADPRALARELITRAWLTPYQVNQLNQGRGQELVLGQYVLLERLGEGGMGQVFKARHRSLGRVVALKVIRKERLVKPDVIRRFRREIQAAAQLKHPNVVMAFDADQSGETHFIAMEYVEGIDLLRLVKTSGPLSIAAACEYIRQAALGLQHAHERGMVHRDIKPANLFVTPVPGTGGPTDPPGSLSGPGRAPQVKILDMGLARLHPTMHDDTDPGLTQEGVVVGTVDYLAPEQASNASTVDVRADIYSLGCTFYFLLAGRVPFPGSTALEKLLKHRCDEPAPVEHLRPEVSPSLAAVVRKLMAKRKEDRYQTPADVATALAAVVSLGGLSRTLALPPGVRQAAPLAILVKAATPAQTVAGPAGAPAAVLAQAAAPWSGLPGATGATSSSQRPGMGKRSWLRRLGPAVVVLLAGLVFLALLLFGP